MNTPKILLIVFALFTLWSCEKDETSSTESFVAAFSEKSISIDQNTTEIQLTFSNPAPENGMIQIGYQVQNLVYATHFTTQPAAENGIIEITVNKGDQKAAFTLTKLKNASTGKEEASITFSILKVDLPGGVSQGNTDLRVSYTETASLGSAIAPEVGGPNQPNQVYIDLSSETQTTVRRDAWDLGFYAGKKFRVKLNSALFMMAAPLSATDIDAVDAATVAELQPKMAFIVGGSDAYVDNPNGDITKTVIAEISSTPEENKVYLLKMGNEIGTATAAPGSVEVSGAERGWKKIRILRKDNGYLLQYADLESTTHEEVFIEKNTGYNFSFFSFTTNAAVDVEPMKAEWDIAFSTFTEIFPLSQTAKTAYGFSDYVRTNRLGNAVVYAVSTADIMYDKFTKADVVSENFSADQQTIGSGWRSVMGDEKTVTNTTFYIIKDADNNLYKLKFTALLNKDGERGHPTFQYDLLQ